MGNIANFYETGEQSSNKGLFNNLVMLTRVDGRVDDSEKELLNRIAERLSLTKEQVKEIMDHPDEYPMIPPISKEERFERFILFIEMIFVDGDVDPSEYSLIAKYGAALGFANNDASEFGTIILNKVKEKMDPEEILKSFL